MDRIKPHNFADAARMLLRDSAPELFVAGVLAVLLVLALVRTYLAPVALPIVGLVAFSALLCCGAMLLRARKSARWPDIFRWGFAGFLAVVWIAAGQLASADHLLLWLR